MKRALLTYLQAWLDSPPESRKPLILRGARQVGKTWLVRQLAKNNKKNLIELNLEEDPKFISLFNSNDPKKIILNLEAALNKTITPNQSLLFLDEIQAAPQLLAQLRWFAENFPELPVIAAGSLLEFVLAEHTFSMPVGRITYAHVEPLSFEEFLVANEKQFLCDYIHAYHCNDEIPDLIHQQLLSLFNEYTFVGGMPAAVASWITEQSPMKINRIQHDLMATYRDDFNKYRGNTPLERLEEVLNAVPKLLGQKFVYSNVNPQITAAAVKQSLYLLEKAKLITCVMSTAANGVPLSAEVNEKFFKTIFLDVGLVSASLGLSLAHINTVHDITLINQGAIAEQIAGQLLRTLFPPYIEPQLFYWQRHEKGSSAEVDYVMQHQHYVVPIEVKAGSTGSLKSLHLLMSMRNYPIAVRINSDMPSVMEVNVKNHAGVPVQYQLLSVPFYLVGEVGRLLEGIIK